MYTNKVSPLKWGLWVNFLCLAFIIWQFIIFPADVQVNEEKFNMTRVAAPKIRANQKLIIGDVCSTF